MLTTPQLYMAITKPRDSDYVQEKRVEIEECLTQVHDWMSANKLKLNSSKTEVMLFGTRQKLEAINLPSLSVAGTSVILTDGPITNLGVLFDSSLSMAPQVNKMIKTASYHLRNIGYV